MASTPLLGKLNLSACATGLQRGNLASLDHRIAQIGRGIRRAHLLKAGSAKVRPGCSGLCPGISIERPLHITLLQALLFCLLFFLKAAIFSGNWDIKSKRKIVKSPEFFSYSLHVCLCMLCYISATCTKEYCSLCRKTARYLYFKHLPHSPSGDDNIY